MAAPGRSSGRAGDRRPCRRCWGRCRRRRRACGPAPSRGTPRRRRRTARTGDTPRPSRHSSITTGAGLPSGDRISAIAASASASVAATTTPLPAASPSALTTIGAPRRRTKSRASAASSKRSHRAVGMPAASQSSLVKALLPSSRAAAAVGPQQAMPAAASASASPATSGASGPGTTRSIARRGRSAPAPAMSWRRSARSRRAPVPGLPGAANSLVSSGEAASAQPAHVPARPTRPPAPASPLPLRTCGARASIGSRAWPKSAPQQRPRIQRQRDLRRGEAHAGGRVRPGAGARRDHRVQALPVRPPVFLAEGRGRQDLRHRVEERVSAARAGAGERGRGDRHRPHHDLRRAQLVSADRRADGICRRRRAAGADRDAARSGSRGGAVRRRAQAALPLLPRVVGVVTSPTGAVLHDIRTTIARRFPRAVLVWPVPVQGEGRRPRSRPRSPGSTRSGPAARCPGRTC